MDRMAVFTMLVLPVHEFESFTTFIGLMPRCFKAIVNRIVFLISFLNTMFPGDRTESLHIRSYTFLNILFHINMKRKEFQNEYRITKTPV